MDDFENNKELYDDLYSGGYIDEVQFGIALRMDDVGYDALTKNQKWHVDNVIHPAITEHLKEVYKEASNWSDLRSLIMEGPRSFDEY